LSSITDTTFFRRRADILLEMMGDLTGAIPDAYIGSDGLLYIVFSIEAGQLETLYLSNQLLLEDMFVTTASFNGLIRHGQQYRMSPSLGTRSDGTLQFSGDGGTYVPVGSEAAFDPGSGLPLIRFRTTIDGTIYNPGVPVAPGTGVNAAAGNPNGFYEYVYTFVTASGETLPSPISPPVVPANQQVDVTGIALGGSGTIARRVYRRKDGAGVFRRVFEIPDNTSVALLDNASDATMNAGAAAPVVDTAHAIALAAQSVDPGVETNVVTSLVTLPTNVPSGITDVTNPTPFTGGTDPEDTESFRAKLLQRIRNPGTGSADDLKFAAENVPGVESATIFENVPQAGHVTVLISGVGGTIADQATIDDAQTTLEASIWRT
jgi:hypothetical protein